MKLKHVLISLMVTALAATSAACGNQTAGTGAGTAGTTAQTSGSTAAVSETAKKLDPVTLKLMAPGDRPADMDKVLAEIEKQGADAVNVKVDFTFIPWADLGNKTQLTLTSGENVDLIFDAPWLHMDKMISQGMYEPLDDLMAQYGQDLYKMRPQQMWDANKWNDKIMGIPFGVTFGGSRSYYIRKDIREKLGIAPIQTHEDLIKFLYAVKEKEPGMIPYTMDKGATDNNWSSWYIEQQNSDQEKVIGHAPGGVGMSFLFYTEGKNGTTIKNIFDNPNDLILNTWKEARKLYQDKIINPDILANNQTADIQFSTGKIACFVSNDVKVNPASVDNLKKSVPTGEIETFSEWNYTPKLNTSDFKQYNFQCIPKVSKNKERAIMFLNWANSTQDNYDLFAYGIKGVNWEPVGDKQYKPLSGYAWFPFVWVWNPTQDRLDSRLTEDDLKHELFFRSADNFEQSVLAGFSFNSDAVANEIAVFNNTETKYMPAIGHGVVDPDETLAKIKKEAYDSMKKIQAELKKQVDAHVAAKK